MADKNEPVNEQTVKFERSEEFADLYANNVKIETSVWDLKMIFGQLDLFNSPPELVRMHTSISVPWPQAKILAYLMTVNIALTQQEQGEIKVSPRVTPPRPDPNNPSLSTMSRDAVIYLGWIWDQFFGDNPYVPEGMTLGK